MAEHTILVVDDDPAILEFYHKIFRPEQESDSDILGTESVNKGRSLRCRSFQDAGELLAWYGKAAPAGETSPVCIVDMRMPGSDGLDAAWGIRRIDPQIEIILCSTRSDKSVTEMRARLRDSFHFVRKPFAPNEFLLLVDSLCGLWERKMALRKSEERHRSLVTSMSEGVLYQTENRVISGCNPAALALLGRTAEEVVGHRLDELGLRFVGRDQREIPFERLPSQRTLATGERVVGEEVCVRFATGQCVWIQLATSPIWDPGQARPIGVVSTFHDITRRLELERELLNQRRRLEEIIEATGVGTWEWGIATGELVVNERWAGIVGYTLEELGEISIKAWIALAHPDDLSVSQKRMEAHFRGETEAYEFDCRLRHKDGRWIWVHDRGQVVERSPEGEPLRMSGTHTDITVRKTMEEELRASNLALEAALADAAGGSEGRSAGLCPDLLEGIRVSVGRMREAIEGLEAMALGTAPARLLGVAGASGQILSGLVECALDPEGLGARRGALRRDVFEARRLVAEIAEAIGPIARSGGFDWRTRCDAAVPTALAGDLSRIRRLVLLLVARALGLLAPGKAELSVDLAGAETGLVDLRFRLTGTAAEAVPEWGSLRRLAETLGGSLACKGAPGESAEFEVVVPCLVDIDPRSDLTDREETLSGESSAFDREVLERTGGDDTEREERILEEFLAGIDTELERLQAVLRGDRWEGARDEAARLSRFAGQVGAIRTGALLAKIADSVSRGRRSQALEEFEGLAPRLGAFRRRVAARD